MDIFGDKKNLARIFKYQKDEKILCNAKFIILVLKNIKVAPIQCLVR